MFESNFFQGIFGFTGGAIDCKSCLPCFADEINAINGSIATNISEMVKLSENQAVDCNRCHFCKTEILHGCSQVECSSLQSLEPMVAQLALNFQYFTSGTLKLVGFCLYTMSLRRV